MLANPPVFELKPAAGEINLPFFDNVTMRKTTRLIKRKDLFHRSILVKILFEFNIGCACGVTRPGNTFAFVSLFGSFPAPAGRQKKKEK
jgi:hypothetical protein